MEKIKRIIPLALLVTFCLSLMACDGISRLRSFFHPEESPQGFEGSTSLGLNITPSQDLNIFLDGELVGHTSPYAARFLPAGPHRLLIEAKGHHPFSLVFDLAEQQALNFPIELRPLKKAVTDQKNVETAGGPALGPDIKPALILVQNGQDVPTTIDAEPVTAAHQLKRFWGNISAGTFSIHYRYDQFGRLEINLPGYPARWVVNDKEVTPGSTHPFYQGKMTIIEERSGEPPRRFTLVRQ